MEMAMAMTMTMIRSLPLALAVPDDFPRAADLLRTVILAQGGFALSLSFLVFLKYAREAAERHVGRVPRGVLAVHMLAVCLLTFLTGWEIVQRYENPLTLRTPVAFLAFGMLDWSLWGFLKAVVMRG